MILNWKPLTLCFFAVALASPIQAQRMGSGARGGANAGTNPNASAGGINNPSVFGRQPVQPSTMQPVLPDTPLLKPQVTEDEACLPWALSQIRGATVSVLRLQVPDKARSEFEKAC